MLSVVHLQRRAVHQRVTLFLARRGNGLFAGRLLALLARSVFHDDQLSVAVDHNQIAVLVRDGRDVDERHLAGVGRLVLRLLRNARRRTADVEGTHGELRAGLADRLGGDDTDRFADLDQLAAGEIAAVAAAADATTGLTGESGTDLHLLDAGFLHGVGQLFGDLVIL